MAELSDQGNVRVICPGCDGAYSTYEWRSAHAEFGTVARTVAGRDRQVHMQYRLYRCAGCGRGGLATLRNLSAASSYPNRWELLSFHPEARGSLPLPTDVPQGIVQEFREAEKCMDAGCWRAAAGLFRTVLDKTLRANGYKLKNGTTLEQQIDMAADDGVITAARRKRAHDEIRVLGNDVLHDDWHEIPPPDVEAARHYAQRILEDFYDDRQSVLSLLTDAKRVPAEGPPA